MIQRLDYRRKAQPYIALKLGHRISTPPATSPIFFAFDSIIGEPFDIAEIVGAVREASRAPSTRQLRVRRRRR